MVSSNALGDFLRARRARVRPSDAGLPAGTGLRRTPGLRREELAALSGVSIDYYIRLEQGKELNPSASVLDALATALRLGGDEHAHLYALANHAARRTSQARHTADRTVPSGTRLLLENLRPCPAYLLGPIGDILAANPEAVALYAGLDEWPEERRNTVRYVFLHPAARTLLADWDASALGCVANLRGVLADDPRSPGLADLVDELTAGSAEFAELWGRYDVRHRRSARKTFRHPVVGELTLGYEVLRLSEPGRRVTIYQAAPGTRDHERLTRLAREP
ncbi:helix-turn-helix domain-containing protein [Actinomadura decatromicini]|uniref:Helix-turn-helix transcriptional regulator n=1 Tax=Actinomadura decatromicini TaxID=2604572 RepID=A0A5D3F7W5_9ACTN|nr:helix-turn-helix transcriptional regulator [Actinomadura decatromicini]TYK44391.1 helix-turn-helix transcriptional regulator [Actinomadura decatromicini]